MVLTEEPLFKCRRILSGLRTDRVGARTPVLLFFALITYPTQLADFERLTGLTPILFALCNNPHYSSTPENG